MILIISGIIFTAAFITWLIPERDPFGDRRFKAALAMFMTFMIGFMFLGLAIPVKEEIVPHNRNSITLIYTPVNTVVTSNTGKFAPQVLESLEQYSRAKDTANFKEFKIVTKYNSYTGVLGTHGEF